MRLEFDDEEELLRTTAREFTEKELQPYLDALPDAPMPRETVQRIMRMVAPLGILSARLPSEAGGAGMSYVQLGILYEELPAEVAMDASGNDLALFRLHHGCTAEVRDRYVEGLASGRLLAGSAISEPGAGSDLSSISTKARREDDHYVVTGTKIWSSQAAVADVLLVAASFGTDERGRARIGRLLVDRTQSPFTIRPTEMIGLRRHHMAEVTFDDCVVPGTHLVGEPGEGTEVYALSWLSHRPCIGLIAVHLAREALARSLAHARQRTQFGRPIGSFQLVQHLLVEMSTLVDTSRYLCYRALHLLDAGKPARYESAVAKAYATEAAVKVTSMAMQVHGAMGLSVELGVEKLFRDARMLTIPDGTTQIQQLIAGRELLGLSAVRG
ncbi:acyl-CoA dehydrogenase family protein [Amycolatopsis jejuensis]|uniref:acyl-CoA dehydrogenase family protein n=1 Tax=Amycolatopsis jejuensis TaxID=330084 RepID=UPI0006910C83|nr:acyl-CoA dehydrogenase family protein [Amycolatopsis jejuensis]